MILPSKHLPEERALLTLGGAILAVLEEPKTVSTLWNEIKASDFAARAPITFDWFVLALDLLASIRAVGLEGNRLKRLQGASQ